MTGSHEEDGHLRQDKTAMTRQAAMKRTGIYDRKTAETRQAARKRVGVTDRTRQP